MGRHAQRRRLGSPDANQRDHGGRKKLTLSEPSLVPQLIDAEGRHTTLAIRTHFMSDEDSDHFHRATRECSITSMSGSS